MYKIVTVGVLAVSLGVLGCGGEEEAAAPAEQPASGAAEGAAAAPGDGPVDDGDTSLPGDPAAGAATYARICVACHGADGRGNGGMTAADFIGDRSRLAKGNNVLLHSIEHGIVNGSRIMPAQGAVLSEQERKDVLSYMRQQFGGG